MIERTMRTGLGGSAALLGLAILPAATLGCGERRDVATLAADTAPFGELRGTDALQLRVGGVRAFRRAAEPAPFEGLREPIAAYDVLFAVPGFDGSDGSWPAEDALVMEIEATREWPSDSMALLAWEAAVRSIRQAVAAEPRCSALAGPGFALRLAEWDRGDGWTLTVSLAPALQLSPDEAITARHSVAVRRHAISARYPQSGQPNPDERPTWSGMPCTPTERP